MQRSFLVLFEKQVSDLGKMYGLAHRSDHEVHRVDGEHENKKHQ